MNKRKKKSPSPRRRRRKEPDAVAELQNSVKHHEAGRISEAEDACRRALQARPEWSQALHVLGIICFRQEKREQSVEFLRKAIEAEPSYYPAYNDLGNMLHELGNLKEAIAVFTRLNELQPDESRTLNNLGVVLKDDDQNENAITVFRKAVTLDPDYLSAYLNLGYAYQRDRAFREAIEAFHHASRIAPQNTEPLRALARLYRMLSDHDQALATYEAWLAIEPDNSVAQHMVVAYSSSPAPLRADDEYVREEFDRFSDSFDEKLTSLNYNAPKLVCEAFARHLARPTKSLVVLDAGCGTGLGGLLLRPYAGRLIGVDLSPGMLSKARETSVYDELVESELCTYLKQHPQTFDLITVIDTFVYFGDLQPPLTDCATSLRAGGSITFTVEAAADRRSANHLRARPHR